MASNTTELHSVLLGLNDIFGAIRPLIGKKPSYDVALTVDALLAKLDQIPVLPEAGDARATLHRMLLALAAKVRAATGGTAREAQQAGATFDSLIAQFRADYSALAHHVPEMKNAPELWK